MDPNIWGDPDRFRPDRFIDQEGNIINREYVIPFSIGMFLLVKRELTRHITMARNLRLNVLMK